MMFLTLKKKKVKNPREVNVTMEILGVYTSDGITGILAFRLL